MDAIVSPVELNVKPPPSFLTFGSEIGVKAGFRTSCDEAAGHGFSASFPPLPPPSLSCPPTMHQFNSASSTPSKDSTKDFCKEVWNACKDISIKNSPFAGLPVLSSKLTDIWQSETDFCRAFGGSSSDNTLCFNGNSASFNESVDSTTPKGLCLERIGNGSYLNMAAHPDGSNRVFLSNQAGKIWLATVPDHGSGGTLELDESNPFLDLTDEVHYDTELGLMGLAFHPNFATNGRFFVSYNCDKVGSASCSGRCSCNSDVGCDPSKLGIDNGAQPCQYQTVVAEFTANGSSSTPATVYSLISFS
ncbi:hypothetical protein B296_00022514 [Ensete ventricosum]|uniref:Glucose/Sorbosone dehydrogenase domain-containing protein n=1 Tax=Ensete ventricosum TaxID=4639 RepID=A0A427A1Q9_ENSVE|nr:hypothetical protein B296_00022514 [Ensete ventricosum]